MFKKILIANRGEIAVRVAKTCREMGIATVAVFSDADRGGVHTTVVDEAHALEGVTSGETYLRIDKIIGIAQRCGADAIHPGFGFLSENAKFAEACAAANIAFIGPTPDAIRSMGDKIIAKELLRKAEVPVVPGWSGKTDVSIDELQTICTDVGYPVLIKAAAGGGGKGMRVVNKAAELPAAFEAAQREANAAFGDARVFVEKYVERARHIEFQIFGDTHGNVVHLFERECSIQRRHQKIVEESPSVALDDNLRARMGAAAVKAALAINYVNAGTVEFMLDDAGNFYFLEVNTRLQVEHPVTEMVTQLDLVRLQIDIAAGKPLPFKQDDLTQRGHAIEVRVYAEDAARGFMPSTGTIEAYVEPRGANIRVDSGVTAGTEVTVHYDPMLSKLIVWGTDRTTAIDRMVSALRDYCILGITTNIEFLRAVVDHPEHRSGAIYTRFLEDHSIALDKPALAPDEAWITAALAVSQTKATTGGSQWTAPTSDPWQTAGAWKAY